MRLYESMNRPAASSEAHVVVARRPGDVSVLSWAKIRRISSTKSRNNNKSTILRPTSLIQSIHLTPAPNTVVDNNIRNDTSRNRSRQVWRTARRPSCRPERSTSTHCQQLRDATKVAAGVGLELRQIYFSGRHSHHPNDAPRKTSPNYKVGNEALSPSYRRSGKRRGRGPRLLPVKMGSGCLPPTA
jgi:hypothetical protein